MKRNLTLFVSLHAMTDLTFITNPAFVNPYFRKMKKVIAFFFVIFARHRCFSKRLNKH